MTEDESPTPEDEPLDGAEEQPLKANETQKDSHPSENDSVESDTRRVPQVVSASYSRGNAFVVPDSSDETDELNEHVHDPGDPDGIVAAEERRQWEEAHPSPSTTPLAEYKPKRLWPKIFITILVIAAAAYGAYWIGNHEATKNQTPPKKQQATQQSQQHQTSTNETVAYTSTNYNLSFNYLKDWTISDTTTKLTVTSPATDLTTVTGTRASVRVVLTIQNPVKTIPGFPTGGAIASLESQDFNYTQPTGVQSAQTYVSYVGYTSGAGLDAIYVTGNSGYQQGQIVPMSDITQVNPFIGVQFETCSDNNCTSGKAVTLNANDWQSTAANKDVTNLIESLQLQA